MEPPLSASAASAESSSNRWQSTPPPLCSSTNWTVRGGSLQDVICFESSASILEGDGGVEVDDDAVSVSGGLLLARPSGQESSPCEIAICFRESHEIHRIYVRSTARVYEIYYDSEWQDRGNEYLCTVRCGPSGKEVFLPRCDSEETVTKDSNSSREGPGKMTKSESNTSGEEDGWVDVKVPDSPLVGDGSSMLSKKQDGDTGTNSQIYYEATAEISDASPCTSIILRLLSLQTKECVHIEEVYIYADPVKFTNSDPSPSMPGNMTGSSLLAMLVPSMLQLSKAGSSKIHDRTVSNNTAVPKHGLDSSMMTKETNPEIARAGMPKPCSSMVEKDQVSAPAMINEVITPLESDKEIPGLHHVPESIPEKDNATHGHLEKKLDELILRVGRIETFFSRFEENMLKPLSCIDTRLQQVEQQLDALSLRTASSKPFQCSRISAPEFHSDGCDSDVGLDISYEAKEDATVDSPDVVIEDPTVDSPYMVEEDAIIDGQHVVEDVSAGGAVLSAADGAASVPVSDVCPGLFMKAPEFMNEEDEHASSYDISESAAIPCPKAKAPLSIDDALTSALEAFMLSTSTNSPKNGIASSVPDSQSSDVAADCPKLDEHVVTNRACAVNIESRLDIPSAKEGGGQGICLQKWPGGSAIERVPPSNQYFVGDEALKMDENLHGSREGSDDDSGIDEAPNEVLSLMRGFKGWDEKSSSDSNIDETRAESHHNMDWLDESSTDSENESSTLRHWLYGHQDDHRFKESRFMGTTNCNDPTTELSGISAGCNQEKSKLEIQKALNSSQNELKRDIQHVLNSSLGEEPSLLDVQFVQHKKPNYTVHLDAMINMVDSESEVHGNDWLNDIEPRQQGNSCSSDTAQLGASVADGNLLIDLDGATVKTNDFSMEGSSNHQLFPSLI